ncbi:MAG: glycosyltransferase family 61 protein [Flavobacteriia bacterium]|nr:glycosyltransferase family 61 protein [Flavobacteriia bacterium]
MDLGHGKLHWFKDVYCIDGKFYCKTLHDNCKVHVAYDSTVDVKMPIVWDGSLKAWKDLKFDDCETIESAFLHKRHISAGYSHIIGDECLPIFYLLRKNNINVNGIINSINQRRPSKLEPEWPNILKTFTNIDVLPEKNYFVKNLYCGWQTNTWTARDNEFDFNSYAQTIINALGIKDCHDATKIVFEVRDSDKRSILNMDEIKYSLKEHNVEYVSFADMSYKDQIETVYNAGTFIAQHGAGLTNLIFMRPKSRVIELLPESYKHYKGYHMFADMFKMDYRPYIEEENNAPISQSATKSQKSKDRDRNLIINIQKFKDEIHNII